MCFLPEYDLWFLLLYLSYHLCPFNRASETVYIECDNLEFPITHNLQLWSISIPVAVPSLTSKHNNSITLPERMNKHNYRTKETSGLPTWRLKLIKPLRWGCVPTTRWGPWLVTTSVRWWLAPYLPVIYQGEFVPLGSAIILAQKLWYKKKERG